MAAINNQGYFGEYGGGIIYDWKTSHSLEISFGTYEIGATHYWQGNLAYRYSHWSLRHKSLQWTPLQAGIFLVTSLDRDRFFDESPSKYPYDDYYDQTAFRGGLELGTVLLFEDSQIAFAYYLRILDTGLIALYNNANKDLQYYLSSGFSLRYDFDFS